MGGLADLSIFETIQNRQNKSIGYSGGCFSSVKNDLLPDDPMFSGLFGSWIDDIDTLAEQKLRKELKSVPANVQTPEYIDEAKKRITQSVVDSVVKSQLKEAKSKITDFDAGKFNGNKYEMNRKTAYPDGSFGDKFADWGDDGTVPYGVLKLLVDRAYDELGYPESPLSKPIYTAEEILSKDIDSQFADERKIAENSVIGPISTDPQTDFFDYFVNGMRGKVNRAKSPLSGFNPAVSIDDDNSLRRIAIKTANELNYTELADFFAHYGQFSQLTDKLYKQALSLISSPELDKNLADAYKRSKVGESILDAAEKNYAKLFPAPDTASSINYSEAVDYVVGQHDLYGVYSIPDHPAFHSLLRDRKFIDLFEKRTGHKVSEIEFEDSGNVRDASLSANDFYAERLRDDE